MYDLDGKTYTKFEHLALHQKIVDEFKIEYPSFIGVKYINQVTRSAISDKKDEFLNDLKTMMVSFLFV